jgi:hypothetical protein
MPRLLLARVVITERHHNIVSRMCSGCEGVLRRIHLYDENHSHWSDKMKTNMHAAWLAAAASAVMIAGAAGIASADNATTAPSTSPSVQQPTGAAAAPATSEAAAPTVKPAKKKERIRRAERGTKNQPK